MALKEETVIAIINKQIDWLERKERAMSRDFNELAEALGIDKRVAPHSVMRRNYHTDLLALKKIIDAMAEGKK